MVPSRVLGIQTAPSPTAGVPGRDPTAMLASTGPEGAAWEGVHEASTSAIAPATQPRPRHTIGLDAEIRPLNVGAFEEHLGRVFLDDAPGLQYVAAIGHGECLGGVLLDQQDGRALAVDVTNDVEDLVDEDGRQSERGLVEEQHLGLGHQPAGDGQHLLLAAREGAANLVQALPDPWEERQDVLLVTADPVPVVTPVGPQAEIVSHAHAVEDASPLRNMTDAEAHDLVRCEARDVPASQPHLSPRRRRQPGDRTEGGRLAGTIAADEGHDLSLLDAEGDALKRMDPTVVGVDGIDLEERHQAPLRTFPQVGFDHPRIAANIRGLAFGDLLAVVEDDDAIRDSHHDLHIVLDQENGDPFGSDLLDQRHQLDLLLRDRKSTRLNSSHLVISYA